MERDVLRDWSLATVIGELITGGGMRQIVGTADAEDEAWAIAHRLAEELRCQGLAGRRGVRPEPHAGGWWIVLSDRGEVVGPA